MSQETRVYRLSAAQAEALRTELNERLPATAEWRSAPHARFALKSGGLVLTCYLSGKLVVQGRDVETFERRFLDGLDRAAARGARPDDPELAFDRPMVGSDEAGKGDYFGALVVAAVFARPEDTAALAELRVGDSKTIADDRARLLAARIEAAFDVEVAVLRPEDYNPAHTARKNLNLMLADLHADALGALIERHPDVEHALVDRFGAESLVADALRQRLGTGSSPTLQQVPRAERHPVVAAASIVARARFLDELARCGEECGTDLPKGAGPPVDRAARRVVEIGGRELLSKVAKVHFKNTTKLGLGR